MFRELDNLIIEIDLSNFDMSKVESIYGMFNACTNLKKVNFENVNTSSVKEMTRLFYACSSLISINLSNFDTSETTKMNYISMDVQI